MAALNPSPEYSTWTTIAHSSLANADVMKLIRQKQIKIKITDSITQGAVIFPKAKVAFLLVDLMNLVSSKGGNRETDGENQHKESCSKDDVADVTARIDKFIAIHRHCYVILQASLFTSTQLEMVTYFQTNYLHHKVDFLWAHDPGECVNAMITVASLQTPPTSNVLSGRYRHVIEELMQPLQSLPVAEE